MKKAWRKPIPLNDAVPLRTGKVVQAPGYAGFAIEYSVSRNGATLVFWTPPMLIYPDSQDLCAARIAAHLNNHPEIDHVTLVVPRPEQIINRRN